MKIRLIWPATSADRDFADAIERYFNRIRHFFPIEIVEVTPARGGQSRNDAAMMRSHSQRLIAAIPDRGYTIVLDERGQSLDSLKFARWLERLTTENPYGINFVVGGDAGFDDSLRQRADALLSLSAMTLPHQIARTVLLEQIYRACTLMRNIQYHK